MEEQKETMGMLDLMIRPGFCVKDHKIIRVNQAAEGLFLTVGTDVQPLLLTGSEEYAAFAEGCLHLTLSLSGQSWGASVTRVDGCDIFVLDEDAQLRTLALAARELRKPMDSLMSTAEQLSAQDDPKMKEQAARLNRGLYQLLRIIGNMSDAGLYGMASYPETRNIGAVMAEICEKAMALVSHTGIEMTYEGLSESVYCLVDADQLERAVLNMLSNAVKFTPKDGTIHVRFVRRGRMLQLSVQDSGSGIAENILSSVFHRHLRQPSIEDSRFGLGLGMVLIRSVAAQHGGTVLIDQPGGKGTRITMTLAIRQNTDNTLRSPVLRPDYAGGRSRTLLGLADILPYELFDSK